VLELDASVGTSPELVTGPVLELPGPVLEPAAVVSAPELVIGRLTLNDPSVVSSGSLQPVNPAIKNASVALVCA